MEVKSEAENSALIKEDLSQKLIQTFSPENCKDIKNWNPICLDKNPSNKLIIKIWWPYTLMVQVIQIEVENDEC